MDSSSGRKRCSLPTDCSGYEGPRSFGDIISLITEDLRSKYPEVAYDTVEDIIYHFFNKDLLDPLFEGKSRVYIKGLGRFVKNKERTDAYEKMLKEQEKIRKRKKKKKERLTKLRARRNRKIPEYTTRMNKLTLEYFDKARKIETVTRNNLYRLIDDSLNDLKFRKNESKTK